MYYSKNTGGFYSLDIHGMNMPDDVVDISQELYEDLLTKQSQGKEIVADEDGFPIALDKPPLTHAQLIANQIKKINKDFELAMQQITTGYPPNEIASWSKQEAEARAYAVDLDEASTPLLDALAQARGLTKVDLADRIIVKADLFATVSGQLIGKRQGLEDALNALTEDATAEDVEAINWS